MKTNELDELLAALEDAVDKKKKTVKKKKASTNDVFAFISKNNIRAGLDRVPNYVIFFTYMTKYKLSVGNEKVSKIYFFRLFSKKFESRRVGKQRYYALDKSQFDLSREGLIEAKAYDEKYERNIKIKTGKIKPRLRRKRVKKEEKE